MNENNMPVIAKSLLESTFKDLDGESLKCINMIGLAEMLIEKNECSELQAVGQILAAYWNARRGMLQAIKDMIDQSNIQMDAAKQFLRHNFF